MSIKDSLLQQAFSRQKKASTEELILLNKPTEDIIELVTSRESIGNQKEINKESYGNQSKERFSNQLVINKESTSNQIKTNKQSISNQLVIKKESISNPIGNQNNQKIGNQLVTKLVTSNDLLEKVKNLSDLQRKFLTFIVNSCISRGQLSIDFIPNEKLRIVGNTTAKTVKTTIQRLKKKGLLLTTPGKRGKSGFYNFCISPEIQNTVVEVNKNLLISNQLVTQLVTSISSELVTNRESNRQSTSSSSSSYINNKTTTTLPDDWKKIDLSEFERNFGFGEETLKQIYELNKFTPSQVEAFLEHFNYDIVNGKLDKDNPLGWFFTALKNGSGHYSKHYMAFRKKAIEEHRKQQEEWENLLRQEEQIKFETWLRSQDIEQIGNSITDNIARESWKKSGTKGQMAMNWIKNNLYLKSGE